MLYAYLLVACVSHVTSHSPYLDYAWDDFKMNFNKVYEGDVMELIRRGIWESNTERIAKHNLEADIGLHKFWLKMNHFGDMTTNEIDNLMTGLVVDDVILALGSLERNSRSNVTKRDVEDLPKHVDWRAKGYVTPVKYQAHCGGCYAFATTGALEGQHFKKTGRLISLSEQNIIDCSESYGNHGCHGGLMDKAYKYVTANGGVDTEKSYPYRAEVETCHYKKQFRGSTCNGFKDLPKGDEHALQVATATVGPISIGIDAHGFRFHFYWHGIYENLHCSSRHLNHGVLIVGYGANEDGDEYWVVKNSWGSWWGDRGYIKMARNRDNQCGIASLASYPLV